LARKSQKIKSLTSKDKQVIHMVSKTGYFTFEQANALNGISKARLDKLTNSGYLIKSISKFGEVYSFNSSCSYKPDNGLYHRASPSHDLKLTEKYLNLSEREREHLIAPQQFVREHEITINVGTPDMIIQIEEQITFIEVITENYTKEQIQQKVEFAKQFNTEVEFIHTTMNTEY